MAIVGQVFGILFTVGFGYFISRWRSKKFRGQARDIPWMW